MISFDRYCYRFRINSQLTVNLRYLGKVGGLVVTGSIFNDIAVIDYIGTVPGISLTAAGCCFNSKSFRQSGSCYTGIDQRSTVISLAVCGGC